MSTACSPDAGGTAEDHEVRTVPSPPAARELLPGLFPCLFPAQKPCVPGAHGESQEARWGRRAAGPWGRACQSGSCCSSGCAPGVGRWRWVAPAVATRTAEHQAAPHSSGRWRSHVSTWMAGGPGLSFLSCPGAPPALQSETRHLWGTTGCSDHFCLLPSGPGQPFVLERAGCVCIHM